MATLGWMAGCWLVSALGLDASPGTFYGGGAVWVGMAGFTCFLPEIGYARGHPAAFVA